MNWIANPVLRGFHPDPSLLRVGDEFFLATSSFEWFPGVPLHRSRDLVHWQPVGSALSRRSQLDLVGVPDSGGIWAPCLSWCDGLFHLVTSLIAVRHWPMMGADNFVVTAPTIEGPWSEPTPLCGWGFDPSLFHDQDGRSWFLSMRMDPRPGRSPMAGIVLQEYDRSARRLLGEPQVIFTGSAVGQAEGPHLYRHDGWYYLVVAEGGTRWAHQATVARSRTIHGPYEVDPSGPLLSSRGDLALPLQKAGHASLISLADGTWWLAHLCSRPMPPDRHCPLGRETALQPVVWQDGWPRLAHGGCAPALSVPAPALPAAPWVGPADDALPGVLPPGMMTLRDAPDPSWFAWDQSSGTIRLRGRDAPTSQHRQSLVARRLDSYHARASTVVDFQPRSYWQMAGLVVRYDCRDQVALLLSYDEQLGRCLRPTQLHAGAWSEPIGPVAVPAGPLHLAVQVDGDAMLWSWSADGANWQQLGDRFGLNHFGDEYLDQWRFTGTMIGLAAYDLHTQDAWATFNGLDYATAEGHP